MNYEVQRNGDTASGVGAGLPRCLSTVDWRTLGILSGMLGQREGERACDARSKGVVTGNETTPTRVLRVTKLTLPHVDFFLPEMLLPSLPTISSKPRDRDVATGNFVVANKVNSQCLSNLNVKLINRQTI